MSVRDGRTSKWFLAYLILVGTHTVLFGAVMVRALNNFVVGDWLINYSGGFVRRGLPGAIALFLQKHTGIAPQWHVWWMQACVFVVLLVCIARLSRGLRWTPLLAAVLLSPVGIGSTMTDPDSGVRKEVLLFASLGIFACLIEFLPPMSNARKEAILSGSLTVMLIVTMLSHEAPVVATPYFAAILIAARYSWKSIVRICTLPAICCGTTLLIALAHPGNLQIATAICTSIGAQLVPWHSPVENVCSGSIEWLQFPLAQARDRFIPYLHAFHSVRFYSILSIPTFAPLIWAYGRLWKQQQARRELKAIVVPVLFSMLGMLLLCYSAFDWGRWIHMEVMGLTLLLLMFERHNLSVAVTPTSPIRRYVAIAAVVLYATTWSLPYALPHHPRGYVDTAVAWLHVVQHRGNATGSTKI
jgi:hypothetical protein